MAAGFKWSWFIEEFEERFPDLKTTPPWEITSRQPDVISNLILSLSDEYRIEEGVAVHSTAQIESHVILKGPIIIGPGCFVASHAYLRGGVYLLGDNKIGPGCEIKSSILFPGTNLAHFNFVGDSVIGSDCNFEAGSIIANHYNERENKIIHVKMTGELINTQSEKFGALVGDRCRVGANAVLSPGSILEPKRTVGRLELVR
jgi:UDP-N-acetylglucosamine diphosphorylase / glucose-1-phosphate thymidylyltransferase / UDP-N-acetylgalactosamine diphosphorylase / glucosamine-1-phosphate N-acetyltransferase / galactosamine-1-phosphate N-acetyltransferase